MTKAYGLTIMCWGGP